MHSSPSDNDATISLQTEHKHSALQQFHIRLSNSSGIRFGGIAGIRGDSRVRVEGEIVVQFDDSGMIQLLVYPVFPACVPGRRISRTV